LTIEGIWSAFETTLFYYSGDSTTGQVCLQKIVSFYSHCRKMKQFIKNCKSYDSCFSSVFHNFLLDAEVSQIHVYFLQIGFVTPAKKRSPMV